MIFQENFKQFLTRAERNFTTFGLASAEPEAVFMIFTILTVYDTEI